MNQAIFVHEITRKKFGFFFLRIALASPVVAFLIFYAGGKHEELLKFGPFVYAVIGVYLFLVCAVGFYLIATPGKFKFSVSDDKIISQYPKSEHLSYELSISDVKEILKVVVKSTSGNRASDYIVTKDEKNYEIPNSYNNPIGKCIKAIKIANPLIEERVEKTMERTLGSEIVKNVLGQKKP